MSERGQLHVVDGATGEASPHANSGHTVAELHELLERKERELNGYRLRLGKAEKELEHAAGVAPGAETVLAVGAYWADRVVEEGWWSRRPAFRPGHPRWSAVAARLTEPEYDIDYCQAVVEGALWQPHSGVKREWVDASSVFKAGNIEKHFERAQDPHCQNVAQARGKMPPALRYLLDSPSLGFLSERCDCGHLRLEHSKADPARLGAQACLTAGCSCEDFDDFEVLAEAWKAERRAA